MKNISFLSENLQFLEAKFSIYLNGRVFVMKVLLSQRTICKALAEQLHFKGDNCQICLLSSGKE